MAIEAVDEGDARYDGYVLLGCVIRGETTHYDIVADRIRPAGSWTLPSIVGLAIGNGILTADNRRPGDGRGPRVGDRNKGGAAAEAALAMIALRGRFGLET